MSSIHDFLNKKTKAELIVLCSYYKQNIYSNKSVLIDSLFRCNITEILANNILSKQSYENISIRKRTTCQINRPNFRTPNTNIKIPSNTTEINIKCRKIGEIASLIRSVDEIKNIGNITIADYIIKNYIIETILINTYGINNYHYLKNETIFKLVNELSCASFCGNSHKLNGKYGIPNVDDRIKLVKQLIQIINSYKEIVDIANTILN
jgi:hypothetical protein